MPDPTTHFAWDQPNVGGDTGAWGTVNNTLHDNVDKTIRGMAGKPSEQMLLPATSGAGNGWVLVNDGAPARLIASISFPTTGGLYEIPLPRLLPGQRVTGFTSRGYRTGTGTCAVKLCYRDATGARTEVSAGHSLPAAEGDTTTGALVHDVAASRAYYIEFTPTNLVAGDTCKIVHVVLAISLL